MVVTATKKEETGEQEVGLLYRGGKEGLTEPPPEEVREHPLTDTCGWTGQRS